MTVSATWDEILTKLHDLEGLKFAAWKSDYPNLNTPVSGNRQEITVTRCASGYCTLKIIDIDNNVEYRCTHNGTNYTAWGQ